MASASRPIQASASRPTNPIIPIYPFSHTMDEQEPDRKRKASEISSEFNKSIMMELNAAMETSSPPVLYPKNNRLGISNSNVWAFFTKRNGLAVCSICEKMLKIGGQTSSLWSHLKRKHPDVYEKSFPTRDVHLTPQAAPIPQTTPNVPAGSNTFKEVLPRKVKQKQKQKKPMYAVMKLQPDTDCVKLFQLALSMGIVDISFVSDPQESFVAFAKNSYDSSQNNEQFHEEHPQQAQEISATDSASSGAISPTASTSGEVSSMLQQIFDASSSTQPHLIEPKSEILENMESDTNGVDETISNNSSNAITCALCGLDVLLQKEVIEDHIRILHGDLRPFQCGSCTFASLDLWRVQTHTNVCHPGSGMVITRLNAASRPQCILPRMFPTLNFVENENCTDSGVQVAAETTSADASGSTWNQQLASLMTSFEKQVPGTAKKPEKCVTCEQCEQWVEAKRTQLIAHTKGHSATRQWHCPFCESQAAFHSKIKLHILNAHKSPADPIDQYTPELENVWLRLFRACFPQFARQCFSEDWRFRSKQQQHAGGDWSSSDVPSDVSVEIRRAILLDGLPDVADDAVAAVSDAEPMT